MNVLISMIKKVFPGKIRNSSKNINPAAAMIAKTIAIPETFSESQMIWNSSGSKEKIRENAFKNESCIKFIFAKSESDQKAFETSKIGKL